MTDLREPDEPDEVLDQRFRDFHDTHERSVRNELVEAHRGLAARIANDYRGRGVELDDLRADRDAGHPQGGRAVRSRPGHTVLLLRQPHRQR